MASIGTPLIFCCDFRYPYYSRKTYAIFPHQLHIRYLPTCNPILNNDSKISEDFPPGFEGQNFKKGNFTQQLQEIDEELTKFDGMEGIDMNAESLPNQDSNTLLNPVSPEIHVPQIPILSVNGFFSS